MTEYRLRAAQTAPTVQVDGPAALEPSIGDLGKSYGLDDDYMIWSNTTSGDQSIEQEFQAYVTQPQIGNEITNLQYWKVSQFAGLWLISADHLNRFTKWRFLHCTPWQWTICQFKPHQCRVKECFRLVARRIQRKGIASMAS